MNQELTINVGEKKRIKLNFMFGTTIIYCGMPNENTFSISYLEASGYQGYGLNIYYPKNTKTIKVGKTGFNVLSITPEKLVLQSQNG